MLGTQLITKNIELCHTTTRHGRIYTNEKAPSSEVIKLNQNTGPYQSCIRETRPISLANTLDQRMMSHEKRQCWAWWHLLPQNLGVWRRSAGLKSAGYLVKHLKSKRTLLWHLACRSVCLPLYGLLVLFQGLQLSTSPCLTCPLELYSCLESL